MVLKEYRIYNLFYISLKSVNIFSGSAPGGLSSAFAILKFYYDTAHKCGKHNCKSNCRSKCKRRCDAPGTAGTAAAVPVFSQDFRRYFYEFRVFFGPMKICLFQQDNIVISTKKVSIE